MAVRFSLACALALASALTTGALALTLAAAAQAADRIYWSNVNGNTISQANLDGSGDAADLELGGGPLNAPMGIALDPATNSIYWANHYGNSIWRANLDGTGEPTQIDTTGATIANPVGLAIHPASNSIYWSSYHGHTISRTNLDGTGDGQDLDTTGVAVQYPSALAIDPESNSIYWANVTLHTISRANLDGTGDATNLDMGTPVQYPFGVAIDPPSNSIYWSGAATNTIWRANLDGTGQASLLDSLGATMTYPASLALDPQSNSIYWASYSGTTISRATLDGSGEGFDLDTTGVTVDAPIGVVVLKAPVGLEPPTVSGGGQLGQELTCEAAAWAEDQPGAFLFRAAATIEHQWLRDGSEIPAAAEPTYTPTAPGSYSCREIASNHAGATEQTSEPAPVTGAPEFAAAPLSRAFATRIADTGASPAQAFTVSNQGNMPLTLSGISLQGADADQFTIVQNACTSALDVGESCSIDVAFSPTTAGSKSATVRFAHNGQGSPSTVAVTGTATAPSGSPGSDPEPSDGAVGTGAASQGPSGATTLPTATGAVATVVSTTLLANRGRVQVLMSCAGRGTCNGKLKIRTAKRVRIGRGKRKRILVLGAKRYSRLATGTPATVRVRLKRKARRLLVKRSKLRVALVLNQPSAPAASTRKGVLHARDSALPGWMASAVWPPTLDSRFNRRPQR